MRVTYLILTWNRKDALRRHLELLEGQTYTGPLEVIVCVDGSTDGTQEMLKGFKPSGFAFRWFDTGNTDSNTAAQAKNIGIREAVGQLIIMADDDCLPHKGLIEAYIKNFNPQEIQLGYKANSEAYLDMALPVPLEPDNETMAVWWKDKEAGCFEHFQCGNCCMSISAARTPARDGSIGFDERFVGYGHEDTEFGQRLYATGHRLAFNPDAVAYHMHPGAVLQQDSKLKQAQAVESNALFQQIIEEPLPPGTLPYPAFGNTTGMMAVEELRWLYETARSMSSVAEIGSFFGRSTHALLSACQGPVYSVDPRDPTFIGSKEQAADVRRSFFENLKDFDNLRVLETYSVLAARVFADASIDMVFIDGDHIYEAVKTDIEAWLPKAVKMICGHDFSPQFPGLMRAVKEAFGDGYGTCETIWYKVLK